ncbi:MAG TPA: ABC transporter permease [Terracidiphilus sp.]|jgi:predicted permease|nr:ABC transporter permease [Terracidiphilus sp.]
MLGNQMKQVFRRLAKAPLFTSVTLITLAVGIGANTVVFSVVDGVLLKPLSYPHSERLVGVWHSAPGVNLPELNVGAFMYFTYREQSKTFEDMGVYQGDSVSVTGLGQPEHVEGLDVTDGTLPLLGVRPMLGRLFTRADDQPKAAKTVVLSYGYWQRRLGGNNSIVGRSITVDGTAHEIIGVLPRSFHFLDDYEAAMFFPIQFDRSQTKLGDFGYEGLARLKPGVTLEQANADVGRMIPIALHSFPPPEGFSTAVFESARIQPSVRSLKKVVIGDVGKVLWVLMSSILVVLLVACANVANLLLVRVEGRRQELAIRSALGAGRKQITLGLLLETLVLSVSGSLIGLGLAFAGLRILVHAAPAGLPRLHDIGIDIPVLLFTLGIALFVALVIGIIPVLKYSGIHLSTGLREGGRALSASRERHRARKTLVVVQVALALVLLICSGLMIRTFRALVQVSPGFTDPQSLLSFFVYIPDAQIPDTQKERVLNMQQAISDKIASLPGVHSVAISDGVPMDGNNNYNPVAAQDHSYKEGELPPLRRFHYVGPGFFSTMGTPLVAGRDFTWAEEREKRPVAIITENFAKEYWGSAENAIGKRVREAAPEGWREIIGVAKPIYDDGVDKPAPAAIFWPLYQDNFNGDKEMMRRGVHFIIRSPRAGSAAFLTEVQQAVWSVNGDLPLAGTTTMSELYRKSMARTSFTLVILGVAGAMALLLGVVGIYGVISYAVSQRTREIGIRMALGAQREQLTAMFVRQGLTLAAIGVVAGLGIAAVALRLMSSLLFEVSSVDPWTYAVSTACILAVALLACYLPARSAAVVNPVNALRAE